MLTRSTILTKPFRSSKHRSCKPPPVDRMFPYRDLAWLLATCPEDRFRDGRRALALASRAAEIAAVDDKTCLAALAAAHAERRESRGRPRS